MQGEKHTNTTHTCAAESCGGPPQSRVGRAAPLQKQAAAQSLGRAQSTQHDAAPCGRGGARDGHPRAARWQHRAVPGLVDVRASAQHVTFCSTSRRASLALRRWASRLFLTDRADLARNPHRAITDRLNSVCCADPSNCADGFPRSCDASCAAVRQIASPLASCHPVCRDRPPPARSARSPHNRSTPRVARPNRRCGCRSPHRAATS